MHYANDLIRRLYEAPEHPQGHSWARPFTPCDPATLPIREWVYGHHYIRRYVSLTVAPGGVGKSSLVLAECIAIATGRPILGITPTKRAPTWYFNGEDPPEETLARIHAILQHHGIPQEELEGWFFWGSGRDRELVVVSQDRHGLVVEPAVSELIGFIKANNIAALGIDPFVSSHRVAENDNTGLDRVAKTWGQIANDANCAVELVHHTRKLNGQSVTVEDGRGASALLAAARSARTLSPLNGAEAAGLGVAADDCESYVRISQGKANLTKRKAHGRYFRLASVVLPNGEDMQAVEPWEPTPAPPLTASERAGILDAISVPPPSSPQGWRANSQAKGGSWAGLAICNVMGWDPKKDKRRAERLLSELIADGDVEERPEPVNGRPTPFLFVTERE